MKRKDAKIILKFIDNKFEANTTLILTGIIPPFDTISFISEMEKIGMIKEIQTKPFVDEMRFRITSKYDNVKILIKELEDEGYIKKNKQFDTFRLTNKGDDYISNWYFINKSISFILPKIVEGTLKFLTIYLGWVIYTWL